MLVNEPASKIVKSSVFVLIGTSVARAFIFFLNVVVARSLTQSEFGLFMMIRSTVTLVESSFSSSIGLRFVLLAAKLKHQSEEADENRLVAVMILFNLMLLLLAIIGLWAFSDLLISKVFLGEKSIQMALFLTPGLLFSSSLSFSLQKIYIGLERTAQLSYLSFISAFIALPIVWFVIIQGSVQSSILGVVCFFTIDCGIKLYGLCDRSWVMDSIGSLRKYFSEVRALVEGTFALTLSVFVSVLYFWYVKVIIINRGNSFLAVAEFDVASQFLTIAVLVTGATATVGLQVFGKHVSSPADTKRQNFNMVLLLNLAVPACFLVLALSFGGSLMGLFGDQYSQAQDLLVYMAILSFLVSITSVFHKYLVSEELRSQVLVVHLLSSLAGVVFLHLGELPNSSLGLLLSSMMFYGSSLLFYIYFYVGIKD